MCHATIPSTLKSNVACSLLTWRTTQSLTPYTLCVLTRPARSPLPSQVDRGVQMRKFGLLMKYYWHRNFGTAMSWFVWDFAFYGNKLFQGTFIKVRLSTEASNLPATFNKKCEVGFFWPQWRRCTTSMAQVLRVAATP